MGKDNKYLFQMNDVIKFLNRVTRSPGPQDERAIRL